MAEVTLPQLGETVTEGTITQWFKQVGDTVAADEPLFEVSTDKVDTEVPSPVAGTLTEIRVQEGETVDVGTVIAVVGDGDGAPRRRRAAAPPRRRRPRRPPPSRARAGGRRRHRVAGRGAARARAGSRRRPATSRPTEPATEPAPPSPSRRRPPHGGAVGGQGHPAVAGRAPPRQRARPRPGGDHRHRPRRAHHPRRRARPHRQRRQHAGGDAGRADRRAAAGRRGPGGAGRAGRPPAPAGTGAGTAAGRRPRRSRRASATPPSSCPRSASSPAPHMVMSKSVSPHAFSVVEVDYANVDRTRAAIKDEWKRTEGFSLTYLPFISRATIDALAEFPHLNASVGEDELVVHGFVDLGIAVDLDYEGLIVPVIREAEGKRLRAIAREINDLAGRARTKKLMPDEISGGTFTISNNGSAGSVLTMPIINQPQVAILSTDAIARKPVVVRGRRRRRGDRHPPRRQPGHGVGPPRLRRRLRRQLPASGSRRSSRPGTGRPSSDGRVTRCACAGSAPCPYREALAVQQALFDHGDGAAPAAARAPARVHVRAAGRPRAQPALRPGRRRRRPRRRPPRRRRHVPRAGPARRLSDRRSSATGSARPSTCATSSSWSSTRWPTLGVSAGRLAEYPGVWVDPDGPEPRKICAIGVRLKRGRTMHGFALNVTTDMRTCASTSWPAASPTGR